MTRRPWQIWCWYAVAVIVALGTLAKLTSRTLYLERERASAQATAQRERQLTDALWRLDHWLTPWLSQELTRPYFAYRPWEVEPAGQQLAASLWQYPSEFVLLHFEWSAESGIRSPQYPPDEYLEAWQEAGGDLSKLPERQRLLLTLREELAFDSLWSQLPSETVTEFVSSYDPQFDRPSGTWGGWNSAYKTMQSKVLPKSAIVANDLDQRSNFFGTIFQEQAVQQQALNTALPSAAREGVSRALWYDDKLLIARRVNVAGEPWIQGCWIDWPRLESQLKGLVSDKLPELTLRPIPPSADPQPGRLLATLPVELQLPSAAPSAVVSPELRRALGAAWASLLVACTAIGLLLRGVVALSERRAEFVSAVTHELRTPLTTFRMYAEMLANGMITDPQQRQHYLETLQSEADRLAHLVDNVLLYARLERGANSGRSERLTLRTVWQHCQPRLEKHVEQAGVQFAFQSGKGHEQLAVETDPAVVDQILFNLVDNACKYASRGPDAVVEVRMIAEGKVAGFEVRDDGPGLPSDLRRRPFRPFSRSAERAAGGPPGVGLGLALCQRLARQVGGRLDCQTEPGSGTRFSLWLPRAERFASG